MWVKNSKFAQWIVILQELNLRLTTPLVLTEFISYFPTGKSEPPLNYDLFYEHLLTIYSEDP